MNNEFLELGGKSNPFLFPCVSVKDALKKKKDKGGLSL